MPADVDPALEARLGRLLMSMHQDPRGQKILAQLSIDRFVPGDDAAYDDIREMSAFLASREHDVGPVQY